MNGNELSDYKKMPVIFTPAEWMMLSFLVASFDMLQKVL
jgi:hypothetical protein